MKNIVLIGFMGTGKTSTGKILATKLGCAFMDLDQKIEAEHQMSIPEMFRQHGENFFRQCERQMVEKVSARRNTVISTGGGTVKDPENTKLLKSQGIMVCLTASVEAILERTGKRGKRPVLDGKDEGDRRKAIEDLLEERRSVYAQADCTVDTTDKSPLQVVDDIIRQLRVRGIVHA